jgi:diguanylate cyclase (GGDEF)-like protein
MQINTAVISISARSTSAVVQALLEEYKIPATLIDNGQSLIEHLSTVEVKGLVFVSLEILREIAPSTSEALSLIRMNHFGPVYVLSANYDRAEFREIIEHGATDIIDVTDLSVIKGIFNTYTLFHQLSKVQRPLVALVVEDSPSQQQMISSVLEQKNIETRVVPTVREALVVLKFEEIDLIITDIHLIGDLTGMHLLREICQSSQWKGIPTFVISGVVPDSSIKEYFQLGIRDFMFKPINVDLLSLRIDNVVRERQTFLELQEEKNRLRVIAFTDTLTELKNRAYLKKVFKEWTLEHEHNFYAFMLDMDNLKTINDEIGHDAGDYAIRAVGQTIKENVSSSDIVIRLGGDEFISLIACHSDKETKYLIENLLRQINNLNCPGNIVVKASIGVVHIGGSVDLSSILKRCDALMYAAKESGKNTIEYEF